MFDRLANGWSLTKQSFQVLMLDKELLLFPVLSGISSLVVLASFAIPLWTTGQAEVILNEGQTPENPLAYVILFLFYFANYFVIVFFNSALVGCAIMRFKGQNPTLSDGLRIASMRLPQILGWALVSATVGFILRLIESRSERVGQIVAGLLGMAWSVVSYFVVPVLVVERLGPVEALKHSTGILRRTWGEALAANFGLGVITFLAALVTLIPLVLGLMAVGAGQTVLGVIGLALGVAGLILVGMASSALNSILLGALYLYAAEGVVPEQFDGGTLSAAFAPR